jgi:hypothetical protein
MTGEKKDVKVEITALGACDNGSYIMIINPYPI